MTQPRFKITDAQLPWTAAVNKLNDTDNRIKRERKIAKIRLAGAYVGIVLGAAGSAYVAIKNQSSKTQED